MTNFSLNHDAIGTTRSGSFPCDNPEEWIPHPESCWVKEQGSFEEWRERARVGDKYYIAPSVYWARV